MNDLQVIYAVCFDRVAWRFDSAQNPDLPSYLSFFKIGSLPAIVEIMSWEGGWPGVRNPDRHYTNVISHSKQNFTFFLHGPIIQNHSVPIRCPNNVKYSPQFLQYDRFAIIFKMENRATRTSNLVYLEKNWISKITVSSGYVLLLVFLSESMFLLRFSGYLSFAYSLTRLKLVSLAYATYQVLLGFNL